MRFSDIPGHADIKQRLVEMVDQGRIPHALLLEGPSGTGKFMLARALASYIHCTERTGGDSCGRCDSCRRLASFNHIDTFYSFPVVKKNSRPTVSADYMADFREFIEESPFMNFDEWVLSLGNANAQPQIYVEEASALLDRLTLTARSSRYKTVLIWLPERLHTSAANKLLKLIEEPSDDTLFIMSSDSPADILPTIYSRTQRIKVMRYSDREVQEYLISHGVGAEEASAAAILSEGNVNKALAVAGHDKGAAKLLDLYTDLMRKAWRRDISGLRQWSGKASELGREGLVRFLAYSSRMSRDNFMLCIGNGNLTAMSRPEYDFSSKFSSFITDRNIEGIIREFDLAASDIAANGNAKIVTFDLAVKMIKLLRL